MTILKVDQQKHSQKDSMKQSSSISGKVLENHQTKICLMFYEMQENNHKRLQKVTALNLVGFQQNIARGTIVQRTQGIDSITWVSPGKKSN